MRRISFEYIFYICMYRYIWGNGRGVGGCRVSMLGMVFLLFRMFSLAALILFLVALLWTCLLFCVCSLVALHAFFSALTERFCCLECVCLLL